MLSVTTAIRYGKALTTEDRKVGQYKMKKLLSAALALTVAVTSLSCTVLGGSSANALPTNQPENADALKGSVTIATLDDYKKNFGDVSGSTYLETQAQLDGVDDLYYDGNNYYWKDNGYVVALKSANHTGYFTGIDEKKLSTVKITTEFLTTANGFTNFSINANGKIVLRCKPDQVNSGAENLWAIRPIISNSSSICASALAYYVVPFSDSEVDTTTKIYNKNGTEEYTKADGFVKDYFGEGAHALVKKNDAATTYFNDGNTYYNIGHAAVEDSNGKVCNQYSFSNATSMDVGGINVTAGITYEKENGIWYATKVDLTLSDICTFEPYKGLTKNARLYFQGKSEPYTFSFSAGKYEIGTELKAGLPYFEQKATNDAVQNNMYLKGTTIEYTEDPTYYLADFNAAYTAMTDAGITAESASVTEDNYNTYVAPVRSAYDSLNAFLKTYVDADKINTLEAVEYVYCVGDRADAFNAAYDKIKNLDAASMTFDELTTAKPDIEACRTEYNKLSADIIKYIPSEKLAQLVSLENAYNGYIERKESGTFYAGFEDNTGSNAALYTSFLNKTFENSADGITKSVIYGNANQDSDNYWIKRCIPDATAENNYIPQSVSINIEKGKAKQLFNNVKNETNTHSQSILRSILTAVNKDFLPDGINKLSFTADISELNNGATYKEFVILYGKNKNFEKFKKFAADYENYSDEPMFGTALKIANDGTVTFGLAYYESVTSAYTSKSDVRLNHIVTDYTSNLHPGMGGDLTPVTQPGDFATKKIDVASGEFNLEIMFTPYAINTDTTDIYATTACYVPTYTMLDGAGSKLIGTPVTYSNKYDTNAARIKNANIFVTNIEGLAIGSYVNDNTISKQELVLDDIYVQGNGANAVTGATILNNNTPSKQDLRFNATLSESNYLKGEGYTVAGYGAVAAVEGQFQNANLSELTVETAEALGKGKAFKYEKEANTVPSNLGVVLGNSAAVKGGIGLQYRVRVYVKYVNNSGEVKYVYSTNRAEGLMENGQHVRSVYSTAKAIANYVKSSGSATYASLGDGNEAAFETAITNIIAGAKSTEKQTVGKELDNGTILLSFTSENAEIIKGN